MGINQIRWPGAEQEERTEHYGAHGGDGAHKGKVSWPGRGRVTQGRKAPVHTGTRQAVRGDAATAPSHGG